MTETDLWKLIHGPVRVAGCTAFIFMVVFWLSRWPGILVAVVATTLLGVVGWTFWVGHLAPEDERLLVILSREPGMPSDQLHAASELGPNEYALAIHRLKDGWWIEWGWGAYHLTPRARARLEARVRET
jgi:hypothetical protein